MDKDRQQRMIDDPAVLAEAAKIFRAARERRLARAAEDDEDIDKIRTIFERGEKRVTMTPPGRLVVSPQEAAELLSLSRLLNDGTLPSVSIGRSRRIRVEHIVELLNRLELEQNG